MRLSLPLWFFALSCAIPASTYAQEWTRVNPVFDPPGNYRTYNGVFADSRHGWWITRMPEASLLATTDGGLSWQKLSDGVALETVEFADSLHGWMGGRILPGEIYNILITKDGGKSWQRHLCPVITSLVFFDSLVGFAGGDSIYKTTDGGISWKPMPTEPSRGIGIFDVFFLDQKYGWAVGIGPYMDVGFILSSADSGNSWQFNDSVTTVGLAICFTDTLHGYVVGSNPPFFEGMVKATSDGGSSWVTQYLPCSWLRDVVFTDDSTGWIVGDYGFIWHTGDRGVTWAQVESGTTSHLYRIFFFENGNIGYIVGEDSTLLRYEEPVGVIEQPTAAVKSFKLFPNYPNPFNSTTRFKFELPRTAEVRLSLYDILGREVSALVSERKDAGVHEVRFDGSALASGIYLYRLQAGSYVQTRRLLLLK